MRENASIMPLRAEALTFEAEGKRLIDGISFTLPLGGITAMIGPNGAGKSLLLRLCHGLLLPTSGTVHWQGGAGEIAGRKRHAMVFQRPVMLRRSVRDNLIHALRVTGHADALMRAETALERFGLMALAARPARLLSGGDQQRLAIARAWSLAPEMLFLDEPCSQLDPGATRQIEEIITRLAAEGMTILMTTHDLGQARRLSQRTLFLHRGAVIEDGETGHVLTNPASQEARAFLTGDLIW